MRQHCAIVLRIWCATGLAACASAAPGLAMPEVVQGVQVELVSNTLASGWSLDAAPRIVEELRIGGPGGDPRSVFERISYMDVDEEGRIYVLDAGAKRVGVFEPEGTFLHQFSLVGADSVSVSPLMVTVLKDEIRILDIATRRIRRFDRLGREKEGEPLDGATVLVFRLPAESEYLEYRQRAPTVFGSTLLTPDAHLMRRPLGGGEGNLVLSIPAAQLVRQERSIIRVQLNAPTHVWAAVGDRVLLANTSEFRVEERSLTGVLTRVFTLDVEPTAVSPARREELLQMAGSRRAEAEVHPYNPVIAGLAEGPGGTRWVASRDMDLPPEERKTVWYLFDEGGRFLGPLQLPPGFTHNVTRHDRIYGIAQDEDGVQSVVRLRVDGL